MLVVYVKGTGTRLSRVKLSTMLDMCGRVQHSHETREYQNMTQHGDYTGSHRLGVHS